MGPMFGKGGLHLGQTLAPVLLKPGPIFRGDVPCCSVGGRDALGVCKSRGKVCLPESNPARSGVEAGAGVGAGTPELCEGEEVSLKDFLGSMVPESFFAVTLRSVRQEAVPARGGGRPRAGSSICMLYDLKL